MGKSCSLSIFLSIFFSLTTSASFLPVFLFSRNDLSTLLAAEKYEHPIFNLSLLHTKRG